MPTLTKKDYVMAAITGVAIAFASLLITYANRRIENNQAVTLLDK